MVTNLEFDCQAIVISYEARFSNMELLLFLVSIISFPKTMKLQENIKQDFITIMVDSGANHNFVSGKFVLQLKLSIEATLVFGVKLGDGHRVQSSGVC